MVCMYIDAYNVYCTYATDNVPLLTTGKCQRCRPLWSNHPHSFGLSRAVTERIGENRGLLHIVQNTGQRLTPSYVYGVWWGRVCEVVNILHCWCPGPSSSRPGRGGRGECEGWCLRPWCQLSWKCLPRPACNRGGAALRGQRGAATEGERGDRKIERDKKRQ